MTAPTSVSEARERQCEAETMLDGARCVLKAGHKGPHTLRLPAPSAPASPKTEAEPITSRNAAAEAIAKQILASKTESAHDDTKYLARQYLELLKSRAPASPEPSVTPKQLADALWQAYYHNDLDDLASDIHFHTIDGNDSPIFHETARAIIRRLVAHET